MVQREIDEKRNAQIAISKPKVKVVPLQETQENANASAIVITNNDFKRVRKSIQEETTVQSEIKPRNLVERHAATLVEKVVSEAASSILSKFVSDTLPSSNEQPPTEQVRASRQGMHYPSLLLL